MKQLRGEFGELLIPHCGAVNCVIIFACSVTNILRPFYGRLNLPTEQAIQVIVTKLGISFTLQGINSPT